VLKEKFPKPTVPFKAVLPNHQVFLPDPVLNWNNQTKHLVDDDKDNHQANQPGLNRHHQNPNTTTVEMFSVLIQ
jgi:hypothetical protein